MTKRTSLWESGIRYNSNDPWGEVVGVVEDVKYDGLHLASSPHLYEPYHQNAWPFLAIALRSQLEQSTLLAAVQREVRALDPNLAVSRVRTMDEVMEQSLATRRLILTLFSLFAGIALILVAVGSTVCLPTRSHNARVNWASASLWAQRHATYCS